MFATECETPFSGNIESNVAVCLEKLVKFCKSSELALEITSRFHIIIFFHIKVPPDVCSSLIKHKTPMTVQFSGLKHTYMIVFFMLFGTKVAFKKHISEREMPTTKLK